MIRKNTPLTNDMLRAAAPSIFAQQPWHKMSDKYAFIPTIDIVDKMRTEGFLPIMANQSNTRVPGKADFTKHVVRFRDMRNGNTQALTHLGQIFPELILTNSHDGASSFQLEKGLFRLVCFNGMTVPSGNVGKLSVHHKGDTGEIIEAAYTVVEDFPHVIDSVERFGALQLTAPERTLFAEAAHAIRYDDPTLAPITPAQLLTVRRRDDAEPTLWNTFNAVQENIIAPQGNARLRGIRDTTTGRRRALRGVAGISEDARVNRALWMLTEKMRELKG